MNILLLATLGCLCLAMAFAADPPAKRGAGAFDVKVTPLTLDDKSAPATQGRMSIDKQYHGDLEATGKGEMLTAMATEGSAVYVAIEHVSGKLNGRSGSFVLYHTGVSNRGAHELTVTIAPDSGTGELKGLAGKMSIVIEGKKHSYVLEYTLP